jgi:hypothetical protein
MEAATPQEEIPRDGIAVGVPTGKELYGFDTRLGLSGLATLLYGASVITYSTAHRGSLHSKFRSSITPT